MGGEPGRAGAGVDVETVMAELHRRVRERLRSRLADEDGARAFEDPAIFADVEALLRAAVATPETARLLLPALMGEPDIWRLTTSVRYQSHRGAAAAGLFIFIKRRLVMPLLRWFYEYSRDNFERQRRVNHVLFACVQELALETALLRREVDRFSRAAKGPALSERSKSNGPALSERSESNG